MEEVLADLKGVFRVTQKESADKSRALVYIVTVLSFSSPPSHLPHYDESLVKIANYICLN